MIKLKKPLKHKNLSQSIPPVSIIIPVKNEADNLVDCLESVSIFDDVIIVDSQSTDQSFQIAKDYQRPIIQFKWNGQFPKKRNWTLKTQALKYPWVLFLDADERVTPEFISELYTILPTTAHHGFWISYKNWFLGKLLKHGDPMQKMALLKVGHGEYEKIPEERWSNLDMEVHEQLVINGSVGSIKARLEHHDKKNLQAYYERHNQYSSWEAQRYKALDDISNLTSRQKLKYRLLTKPYFPLMYFLITYCLKKGFLDGWAGFYFSLGKMFYFYQIQAKIKENDET